MTTQYLKIEDIALHESPMTRAHMNQEYVDELAAMLLADKNFDLPECTVWSDGSNPYLLSRGRHRRAGYLKAGRAKLPCKIKNGDYKQCLIDAVGDDATHGLRLTEADRRQRVLLFLGDDEWKGQADRWIAETCRVATSFVADIRESLLPKPKAPKEEPSKAKDRNGTHEREPGEDESYTQQVKDARNGETKPGQQLFDVKIFNAEYGQLLRQIDKFGNAYGCKDSFHAKGLRSQMKEFRTDFAKWYLEVTKQELPE